MAKKKRNKTDKHHDDKLIIISVVAAVAMTKLGDIIITNDPLFGWLNIISNQNLRGLIGFVLFIFLLVMITYTILPLIKWVANKGFENE